MVRELEERQQRTRLPQSCYSMEKDGEFVQGDERICSSCEMSERASVLFTFLVVACSLIGVVSRIL